MAIIKKMNLKSDILVVEQVEGCEECGSTDIIIEHGEKICSNCGLVIDTQCVLVAPIPYSDRNTEQSAPLPRLTTTGSFIGRGNRDYNGDPLKTSARKRAYTLRKVSRYFSHKKNAKVFDTANALFHTICEQLRLSNNIKNDAIFYFKKVKKSMKGRITELLVISTILIACRFYGQPILFEDFACFITSPSIKEPVKAIKSFYLNVVAALNINVPRFEAVHYIPMFCDKLGLPHHIQIAIIEELNKIPLKKKMGKDPKSIAAAVIYETAKEYGHPRAQVKVADVANISEAGLRNTKKWLYIKYL